MRTPQRKRERLEKQAALQKQSTTSTNNQDISLANYTDKSTDNSVDSPVANPVNTANPN
ncbi:hypothetical protein H8L32_01990 [Undibacterium sp. CY18W]|uniref:Uncharacterized protein n=2 Tax=Undibacterium hunanense TaxID=2762292 RepID=A0ABR6ZK22_9BURK|nr:hypothetical protein [Undibacterium hunanense]